MNISQTDVSFLSVHSEIWKKGSVEMKKGTPVFEPASRKSRIFALGSADQRFIRFSMSSSTTAGSASVEVSPRLE